MHFQIKH